MYPVIHSSNLQDAGQQGEYSGTPQGQFLPDQEGVYGGNPVTVNYTQDPALMYHAFGNSTAGYEQHQEYQE